MLAQTMYIQLLFALPRVSIIEGKKLFIIQKGVINSIFCGTDINPIIWPFSFLFISVFEDLSFDLESDQLISGLVGAAYFLIAAIYNQYCFHHTMKRVSKVSEDQVRTNDLSKKKTDNVLNTFKYLRYFMLFNFQVEIFIRVGKIFATE